MKIILQEVKTDKETQQQNIDNFIDVLIHMIEKYKNKLAQV